MKEKTKFEIKALVLVAAGLLIFASLISFTPYDLSFYTSHPNIPPKNLIRTFGAYLGGLLLFLFGWASYVIPAFIIYLGAKFFKQAKPGLRLPRFIGLVVLILSLSSLIGLSFENNTVAFSRGGILGFAISGFVGTYFGKLGGYITFITLGILSLVLVTDILISAFLGNLSAKINSLSKNGLNLSGKKKLFTFKNKGPKIRRDEARSKPSILKPKIAIPNQVPEKNQDIKSGLTGKPKIQIKEKPKETDESKMHYQEMKIGDYQLPSLDLLDSPPPLEARQIKEDLEANARVLEETLGDFGISVKVTDIERGPVITRYELEPAPGVKLNRIVALSDDISLAMKAPSVRIVAPIPGKARVGIEVPNMQSNLVYLKETLISKEFQSLDSNLNLALGKDIAGHPVVTELDDMPHLLIAGTTGSGKTVCVNSLILSLLFRRTPNELKFLMVDPKMVELAPFNGLPHLLCPVVTDAKKAAVALNWVVGEMEERYQLLAKVGARNIDAYNEKGERIPYIVIIIDELADLMMVSRDQIESAITRLAQLSRAVGIHLILATQRPSVDVITGVIKANFPARISFKVASKVDSRTVLDINGADKLLGKGDMLFLQPGVEKVTRAQGTLVTDSEIEKVVSFIKAQAEPIYDDEVLKDQHKGGMVNGQKDDLYDQAVKVVMESNQASVSILQRRMRLGYTRAARIIDSMEMEGLVGPFEGSKPRRILIDREQWLQDTLNPQANEQA